jgi:outer membrane protein TolC
MSRRPSPIPPSADASTTAPRRQGRRFSARPLLVFLLLSAGLPASSPGQPLPTAGEPEEPLLTLDEALSQALSNNRDVRNSVLQTQRSEHEVGIARSKRLPKFHVDALAGSLLQPFDFTFPAGSFGTYPEIGPIPSTDAKIRTPAQFTTFITAGVDQPLTQQHKIGLGIKATELGRDMAREGLRAERQQVASQVRSAYFDLVATQAALEASREAVRLLEEAQRVTAEHEAQQTVLRADALEVDARLAKSRYELQAAESRLATRREVLNDLLGRELDTRFRVEAIPEQLPGGLTLETARRRAADSRPEIRQALMRREQADYERRIAKADYIPDVSLSVRYLGFYNFEVLPQNVTVAGLYLSWEPFDWKRRAKRVAEKTTAVDQARNTAQQTQSQVAIEVGVKHRTWSDTSLLVQAARIGHEAAREQLRVTANRYREDAALLKELLQAQARASAAAYEYQQALSAYWGAMAELRRVMGDE